MCIKLRAKVPAREILEDVYDNWNELHGDQFYKKASEGTIKKMDKDVSDQGMKPAMA